MITLIKRTINFYFKSSKEFIFLFIFPMIIMTAQYMMMDKVFGGNNKNPYKDVVVSYEINDDTETGINEEVLISLLTPLEVELSEGKLQEEKGIQITISKNEIDIVADSGDTGLINTIETILQTYNRKVNLLSSISSDIRPENNEIKINEVKPRTKVSSKDHYGITMITIFFITIGLISSTLISRDKFNGMKQRMKTIGVTNKKYYIGTLIGFVIIAIIGLLPGYLYSYFILGTNWGDNIIIPYLAFIPFYVLFIALGIGMTTILKSGEKAVGTMGGVAFPILGALGGAFIPLDNLVPEWLNPVTYISPLRWYNSGIMEMIYKDNFIPLLIACVAAFSVGVIIILITINYSNKEERLA